MAAGPAEGGITAETAALRDLQAAVASADAALARRMAMFPTDLAAMGHLSFAREPVGPRDLSRRLGLSPAATTDLVDRLERAGHLERRRDLTDRRRLRLVPSEAATAEVLRHLGGLFAALDAVAEGLGEEEREIVRRYLEQATEAYRRFAAGEPSAAAGGAENFR